MVDANEKHTCIAPYFVRFRFVNLQKFRAAIMDFRQALNLDPTNQLASQYLESTMQQEEEFQIMVRRVKMSHRLSRDIEVLAVDRTSDPFQLLLTCWIFNVIEGTGLLPSGTGTGTGPGWWCGSDPYFASKVQY